MSMSTSVNAVLAHKLEVLDKYLRLEANELIFNRSYEIYVDYGDTWDIIEDKRLSPAFLSLIYSL